ncbi:MAG: transglutaminase domain-containing protein [Desulfobacterales bacterium]|nr:transglutaminase domain-containing protein [Desulfobacterales bacterium]
MAKRTYFGLPAGELSISDATDSLEESETWMAVYHHDDKVGYARSRFIKQPDGFMVLEKALMNLRITGSVHRISTEITGHLNQDASLRSFVFFLHSGLVRFEARGRVEDKKLVLSTRFGGDWRKSTIMLQDKPYLSAGLWPHLVEKGVAVGARYRLSVFDPSTMAQRPVDVEVVGRETIAVAGRKWDALKVRTMFMGAESFAWIGPKGERLKEEGIMGLRLVKATEKQALSGIRSDPGADITEDASVTCNRLLKGASKMVYLKVRFDGGDLGGLDLDGGRQHLAGSALEIALESAPFSVELPSLYDTEHIEPYLRVEPMVQSDHPGIKVLAGEIVDQAKDSEAKARKILDWVHKSLDKRATVSVPSALGTLSSMAGDCNEHAVLFASLLRAAKIPAKLCAGLVYTRGRFYYHAWNEVFLGKWVTADALMGQMPADVTHIRLVEGGLERQADIVGVIGRLRLDVLEAR